MSDCTCPNGRATHMPTCPGSSLAQAFASITASRQALGRTGINNAFREIRMMIQEGDYDEAIDFIDAWLEEGE